MELDKNSVLVILVIAFLVVGAYVFLNFGKTEQVISSQGSAEITADPDHVLVYISVETKNQSADDAKDANAVISDAVITELVKLGFDRDEIETENYNIYPEYSWENNRQNFQGYKAVNNLKVKVENFDKTGDVVDAAVDSGALIQYISFELSLEHENELKAQVLEEASKDARTKAEALAKGSGKKLGSLVSINSGDYQYYPYRFYEYSAGASAADVKEATTSIQPKSLTVSAYVQATYKIK